MVSSARPFHQIKFCCTALALDVKSELSAKIEAMGGICYPNLMSDINVLIVGGKSSDKYLFSVQKRYDILFTDAQSILDLHSRWSEGENITIGTRDDSSELAFIPQLKPFQGMCVSISRIDSGEWTKKDLCDIIEKNGGQALVNLTAAANCLVTTERAGRRYEKAVEWEIPVIHPNWVRDSVRRGALLDPLYYDLSKVGSVQEMTGKACVVWKQLEEHRAKQMIKNAKRKAVHTEPVEEEEEDDLDSDKTRQTKKTRSSLTAWKTIVNNKPQVTAVRAPEPETERMTQSKNYLFKNLRFLVYGFSAKQTAILSKIITSHNGSVEELKQEDKWNTSYPNLDSVSYAVIPHNINSDTELRDMEEFLKLNGKSITILTEWFIERSLYYNQLKLDLWVRPIVLRESIAKYPSRLEEEPPARLKVGISGFSGCELLHIEKLLALLSTYLEFSDKLTKNTNFLIINTSLIGLTEHNSKSLFENNDLDTRKLLRDVECNKISLLSMKKKLIFCQENNIPMFAVNFLFELFLTIPGTARKPNSVQLSDLRWCIYYPKRNGSGNANKQLTHFRDFFSRFYEIKENKRPSKVLVENKSRTKDRIKLSGKASESSLTCTNEANLLAEHPSQADEASETEKPESTQVTYGQQAVGGMKMKRRLDIY